MRNFIKLLLTIILALSISQPGNAITFGKEVVDASVSYPSVVSIWYSQYAGEDAEFICSGTLIEPRIVLTAAHCVLATGLYYVQYGADQLDEEIKILEVDATWKNPRYSERQGVNDIGLLLLTEAIPNAQVTGLSAKSILEKVQSNKSVKYEIAGWGKDQNSERATYLRKLAVDDQTAFAKKIKAWAPWRNDIWFAVGKYNSKERVFAGACNGDSGGPLFAYLNGKTYLTGVTSWGAEDCEIGAPSVYVRLSYYIDTIKSIGIPQLYVNENKQNRALPSVITEPKIQGTAQVGSYISCNTGTWSSNTDKITYSWSGTGVPYGYVDADIYITENTSYYQKTYICTVTASNANGSVKRELSITQSPKPYVSTRPQITNMPTVAFSGEVTVSCSPGIFSYATNATNEWWVGDYSYSDPTSKLANGNTIILNASIFTSLGGKYLFCKSTATGEGGVGTAFSNGVTIPSFQKPSIKTYPSISGIGYQSPAINSVATCSGWSWSNTVTQEIVEWYVNSYYSLTGATKVGSGNTLTLTSSFLNTNKSNYVMCAVTGTNLGGSQTTYTGNYLYYYPTSSSTPTPTPTPSPTNSNSVTSVKPNAPFNFGGTIGATTVTLNWSMPSGNGLPITSFSIERSSSTSGWTVINNSSTQVTYVDSGLTPGLRYDYRVRAYNGYNYSDYSSTISANIPVAATPTPTPTPTAVRDLIAPVGSNWNSPSFSYPGGVVNVSFKATDNVGVTKAQVVLVKGGIDILTQVSTPLTGFTDFYQSTFTMPIDASGSYGIRFEAYDAAGNKYSWTSSPTPVIVSAPVYLGGASSTTTAAVSGRVKAGDTFSCSIGNWANLGTKYQIFCLWSNWTTGAQYEGSIFTVTQALVDATSNKTLAVTLRARDVTTGAVVGAYTQEPGGLATFIMDQLKAWSLDGPR